MAAKSKLNKADIRKKLSLMQKFNSVATDFLDIVNNQIDIKEKRIQVLVTGMPVIKSPHTNISITTIDMKKTKARKKGAGSWNEIMDWEKDFGRERNRGTII